ncbi:MULTISPECIES: ATP-binding protein [unclassified Streptomyces]|uniref:ATP-binding protein n=1 Tax=unclassified Streptomyces TaxID=2593676 RepID=UPI0029B477F9|nr:MULTISPECIES: ATP-binding protein [unclassified Streptomyces]MDX3766388.1 ATP-binding protein [Streptomyces sp. AK08-01B]MDX3816356.1 ATP-binding protein [Streptomyces sp. AK08-01A]
MTTTSDKSTTDQRWQLWLTPFPKTVSEARRQLRSALTDWQVPQEAVDTAVLITSELVTNAIRHCDNQHLVHLQVTDDGAELLLEVSDPSRNPPRPVVPPTHAESGRGLFLVRAAASAFGARHRDPVGKTVWATVPRTPTP